MNTPTGFYDALTTYCHNLSVPVDTLRMEQFGSSVK
jgi:hypothetical protein